MVHARMHAVYRHRLPALQLHTQRHVLHSAHAPACMLARASVQAASTAAAPAEVPFGGACIHASLHTWACFNVMCRHCSSIRRGELWCTLACVHALYQRRLPAPQQHTQSWP